MVSTMDARFKSSAKKTTRQDEPITHTRKKIEAREIRSAAEEFHVGSKFVHLKSGKTGYIVSVLRSGPTTNVVYKYDDQPDSHAQLLGHGYTCEIGILWEPLP